MIMMSVVCVATEGHGGVCGPEAGEDHSSLALAWAQVAEREYNDQELLQRQECQQQHQDLRGQRGQEAQQAAARSSTYFRYCLGT